MLFKKDDPVDQWMSDYRISKLVYGADTTLNTRKRYKKIKYTQTDKPYQDEPKTKTHYVHKVRPALVRLATEGLVDRKQIQDGKRTVSVNRVNLKGLVNYVDGKLSASPLTLEDKKELLIFFNSLSFISLLKLESENNQELNILQSKNGIKPMNRTTEDITKFPIQFGFFLGSEANVVRRYKKILKKAKIQQNNSAIETMKHFMKLNDNLLKKLEIASSEMMGESSNMLSLQLTMIEQTALLNAKQGVQRTTQKGLSLGCGLPKMGSSLNHHIKPKTEGFMEGLDEFSKRFV